MLKATLTFVKRKEPLVTAGSLAELDEEDVDFLTRHVQKLREAAGTEEALLSRFQSDSGIPAILRRLLVVNDSEFIEMSAGLATRLHTSMNQSTKPAPGVLAIIASGTGDEPSIASVLKLDAISEAASIRFEKGQVKLNVLRDLLPAPGQLQKGISLPDLRDISDAIVIDRNQSAAQYFFNAYELHVSPTPAESERALGAAIIMGVARQERAEAMRFVADLSGPANEVAKKVKGRYPDVQIDRKELGAAGALGGYVRLKKVAGHLTRFRGDGIVVTVPHERLDHVTGPRQVAGGWEITLRFSARPEEDTS